MSAVSADVNPYPVGPSGPIYLSTAELAARWSTKESTLRQWRSLGEGPLSVSFGRVVRYPLPEVEAYEAKQLDAARREQRRRATGITGVTN